MFGAIYLWGCMLALGIGIVIMKKDKSSNLYSSQKYYCLLIAMCIWSWVLVGMFIAEVIEE